MIVFQEVIEELISKGWTQSQIANTAGCAQSNIARLLKHPEAEPRWSTGDSLLLMNKYVTRRAYLQSVRRRAGS